MPGKAVAGVFVIHLHHHAVAGDLGDNRGAGYGKTEAVTIKNSLLRQ
jgi:hypothetical protein